MAEPGEKDAGRRPRVQRTSRARGGLGQGLGALIPDREPTQQKQEKPLDVLFPDLTGRSADLAVQRGGSARDLLSPRGGSKSVSRETIDSSGAFSDRSNRTVHRGNVSRETIAGNSSKANIDIEARADEELLPVPGVTFGHVDPTWIIPNLKQPRSIFDEGELEELATSIAEVGVLQPVVVRRITAESLAEEGQADRLREALVDQPEARYELVMGERRWRASKQAGLQSIPIIVRSTGEDELLREALIENIHRVQLNALEEAAAYSQLMEDFGYTQEQLATRVSKSRPQVANTLRLLKLPTSVQRMLAAGVISPGHARTILSLGTQAEMQSMADRIVSEGLSVRATEELAKFGKKPSVKRRTRPQAAPSEAAQRIADAAATRLDTSVRVVPGARKSRLIIEFADQADLDRIASELGL
jgi:ParB family chromosome partitioning protein